MLLLDWLVFLRSPDGPYIIVLVAGIEEIFHHTDDEYIPTSSTSSSDDACSDNNSNCVEDVLELDCQPESDECQPPREQHDEHPEENRQTSQPLHTSSSCSSTSIARTFASDVMDLLSTQKVNSELQLKMVPTSRGDVKKFFCIYCHKKLSKLARHLTTVHKDKAEIKSIIVLPAG